MGGPAARPRLSNLSPNLCFLFVFISQESVPPRDPRGGGFSFIVGGGGRQDTHNEHYGV